jgi:hypothetical protein
MDPCGPFFTGMMRTGAVRNPKKNTPDHVRPEKGFSWDCRNRIPNLIFKWRNHLWNHSK